MITSLFGSDHADDENDHLQGGGLLKLFLRDAV